MVVYQLTDEQRSEDFEGFVGSTASSGRVDAYHLHLMAVLAAYADTKGEASRSVFSKSRDLSGDGYRMAECQ
tara:strand:- start:126 stop:341 length:216 start_codon:yes stop_codon:yes gene_type:complete